MRYEFKFPVWVFLTGILLQPLRHYCLLCLENGCNQTKMLFADERTWSLLRLALAAKSWAKNNVTAVTVQLSGCAIDSQSQLAHQSQLYCVPLNCEQILNRLVWASAKGQPISTAGYSWAGDVANPSPALVYVCQTQNLGCWLWVGIWPVFTCEFCLWMESSSRGCNSQHIPIVDNSCICRCSLFFSRLIPTVQSYAYLFRSESSRVQLDLFPGKIA